MRCYYVMGSLCCLAFMEGSGSSSSYSSSMTMMSSASSGVSAAATAATPTPASRRSLNSQQRLGSRLIQQKEEEEAQQYQQQKEHIRMPLVRRLYGPDNAVVRRNVLELEERLERSQTGFLGNANHVVPYDNHPFEVMQRRRRQLQEAEDDAGDDAGDDAVAQEGETGSTNTVTSIENSLFRPIRIHFETKALDDIRDEENAAKIECKCVVLLSISIFALSFATTERLLI
jgi:hypothetical protein